MRDVASEISLMTCDDIRTIHIFGLGAIGTLLGFGFAKAGLSVHTYAGGNSHVRHLTRRQVHQTDTVLVANHRIRLPRLQENDAVLVSVKWPHLEAALSSLSPFLHRASVLLPQNGIVDDRAYGLPSHVQIVPIVVRASAKTIKRGIVATHGPIEFVMRNDAPLTSKTLLMKEGFRFVGAGEFRLAQVAKLLVACMGAKMALRRVSIGEAFRDEELRQELTEIVSEAASVLVSHSGGEAHFKAETDRVVASIRSGTLVDVNKMKYAYTSMHYDFNVRAQETEVQWLNGLVVNLANRLGMTAPLNSAVLQDLECRQDQRGSREDER
jgi:2-dehydropantoate 2-reductase